MTFGIFLSLVLFPISVVLVTILVYLSETKKDRARDMQIQKSSNSDDVKGEL
ncbi:hypothetical protein [Alkalihalobacterium elongatum]|uniref:hypothetical protein n=1 Tax=Alkalihalobacterium elongatum TaxID=2675466 RepID=UPI001C1FAEBC|nr:hypothetical protein [Alkalihalobacterium elongatum]